MEEFMEWKCPYLTDALPHSDPGPYIFISALYPEEEMRPCKNHIGAYLTAEGRMIAGGFGPTYEFVYKPL
jgi:hypothetical protein